MKKMAKTMRIGNFFAAMDKSSRNSPIDASFTSLSHELQTSTSSQGEPIQCMNLCPLSINSDTATPPIEIENSISSQETPVASLNSPPSSPVAVVLEMSPAIQEASSVGPFNESDSGHELSSAFSRYDQEFDVSLICRSLSTLEIDTIVHKGNTN